MDFTSFTMNSQPNSIMDDDNDDALGFDESFESHVPEAYECPICLLVINKPVQTECGHRFCKSCIMRVLREGRRNCPIDNDELSENQIYPDNFARREINVLRVHCRNWKSQGCNWVGPLKDLQSHLPECDFSEVECPNCCGQRMRRRSIDSHVNTSCARRIVSCSHCELKIVSGKLEEHNDRCPRFPVACPNGCGEATIPREKLDEHIERDCPEAVSACMFRAFGCTFEGLRAVVANHEQQSNAIHWGLAVNKVRQMATAIEKQQEQQEKLKEEVARLSKNAEFGSLPYQPAGNKLESTPSLPDFSAIRAELEEAKTQLQLVKATAERSRSDVRELENDLGDQIKRLQHTVNEQSEIITELSARLWCGKFIWRISSFEKLFAQSKSGDVPAIHSLPFYTAVPGYKMCLRVNLNGIDSGANTHISMFVHLMMGDFDSILAWPFPGTIVLTVMDQTADNPQHVRETLNARPTLQAFQRPKVNRNHKGYGYVEMIPHQMLFQRNYIKDDTIVVKVEVRMPT